MSCTTSDATAPSQQARRTAAGTACMLRSCSSRSATTRPTRPTALVGREVRFTTKVKTDRRPAAQEGRARPRHRVVHQPDGQLLVVQVRDVGVDLRRQRRRARAGSTSVARRKFVDRRRFAAREMSANFRRGALGAVGAEHGRQAVRLQRLGHGHRAVRLLVRLEHADHRPRRRHRGAVQRVQHLQRAPSRRASGSRAGGPGSRSCSSSSSARGSVPGPAATPRCRTSWPPRCRDRRPRC